MVAAYGLANKKQGILLTVGETGVRRDGLRFPPISPNLITLFNFFYIFMYLTCEGSPHIFYLILE
jgi:hypothetical protein